MIRVMLVDDQLEVREGQRIMLDAQSDITVVGEAGTGHEALQMARTIRPDVVVIDVRMPGIDGVTTTGLLLGSADWPVRVIVMTTFDLDEYVFGALRLGASGFLLKTTPLRRLPTAVREVHAGETMLSSDLTQRLVRRFASIPAPRPAGDVPEALSGLTPRELDVLRLLARGLRNDEIAAELFVSPSTIKTHVVRILAKLDLRDRTQAAVAAYEHGFVVVDQS